MQRILDPAQIEAFAQRAIPRIRLPDRESLFAARAERLSQLSADDAVGHSIGDYLRLMAAVADAQQAALASLSAITAAGNVTSPVSTAGKPLQGAPVSAEQLAQAREHRMPIIHATSWRREGLWRDVLNRLCDSVAALPGYPPSVREVCLRLRNALATPIEAQADALLSARTADVDAATAPFVMAALQVYWVHLASRLATENVTELDVQGVCPVCGTLPVASVVRADKRSQGYRYLHCALCSTEWHMVRVTCTHCQSTQGISYHSIEGGSEAIRAESCDSCHTYRKILYQEKDSSVEPVADDLASLALDLLLTEAGYHRGSGNPLLWQRDPGHAEN